MKQLHTDPSSAFGISAMFICLQYQIKIFLILYFLLIQIGTRILFILHICIKTTSGNTSTFAQIGDGQCILAWCSGIRNQNIFVFYRLPLCIFESCLLLIDLTLFKKSFSCLRMSILWFSCWILSSGVTSFVRGRPLFTLRISLKQSKRWDCLLMRLTKLCLRCSPSVSGSNPYFLKISIGDIPSL